MMRRAVFLAVVLSLAAVPATAKVLPLDRAFPHGNTSWGYHEGVTPSHGFSSSLNPAGFPFEQETVAYDTKAHTIVVGCRGEAGALVRAWIPRLWLVNKAHNAHGFGQWTCTGTQPWHVLLRNVTPNLHVEASVVFER